MTKDESRLKPDEDDVCTFVELQSTVTQHSQYISNVTENQCTYVVIPTYRVVCTHEIAKMAVSQIKTSNASALLWKIMWIGAGNEEEKKYKTL